MIMMITILVHTDSLTLTVSDAADNTSTDSVTINISKADNQNLY